MKKKTFTSASLVALSLGATIIPAATAVEPTSEASSSYGTASDVVFGAAAAEPTQLSGDYITVGADPDAANRTRISFDFTGVNVKASDYFYVSHEVANPADLGTKQVGTFAELYPKANAEWLAAKGSTAITGGVNQPENPTTRNTIVDQDGNILFNITSEVVGGVTRLKFTAGEAFSRAENPVVDARGYTNVILSTTTQGAYQRVESQLGDVSALPNASGSYTINTPTVVKVNGVPEYDSAPVATFLAWDKYTTTTGTTTPTPGETGGTYSSQKYGVDTFHSSFKVITSRSQEGDAGTRQTVTSTVNPQFAQYFTFEQGADLTPEKLFDAATISEFNPVITSVSADSITIEYTAPAVGESANLVFNPDAFFAHPTLQAAKDNITNQVKFTTTTSHETAADTVRTESRYSFVWLDAAGFNTYPPTARDDTSETSLDTPVTKNLIENDLFPGGDFSTITILEGPKYGSATVNPDGSGTYTPDPLMPMGSHPTIKYEITDSNGHSSVAVWTILMNPATVSMAPVPTEDRVRLGDSKLVSWLPDDLANATPSLPDGSYSIAHHPEPESLPAGYAMFMAKLTESSPYYLLAFKESNMQGIEEAVEGVYLRASSGEITADEALQEFLENPAIEAVVEIPDFNTRNSTLGSYHYFKDTHPELVPDYEEAVELYKNPQVKVWANESMSDKLKESGIDLNFRIASSGAYLYQFDGYEVVTPLHISFYDLSATLNSEVGKDGGFVDPQNADEAPAFQGFDSQPIRHTFTNTGDEPWEGLYIENLVTGERTPIDRTVAVGESFSVESQSGALKEGVNEIGYRLVTGDDRVVAEDTVWLVGEALPEPEPTPEPEPEPTPEPTPVDPEPTPEPTPVDPEPTPEPTPVDPEPTPEEPEPTPVNPEPTPEPTPEEPEPSTPATPEPTPEEEEVTPKKDLEEKPQDSESKDTNTAANPFERASGGSALLLLAAGASALGLTGLAARLRRKAE